jgi:hypothetical protein
MGGDAVGRLLQADEEGSWPPFTGIRRSPADGSRGGEAAASIPMDEDSCCALSRRWPPSLQLQDGGHGMLGWDRRAAERLCALRGGDRLAA